MSSQNVEVLNNVTQMLIDSQKGYEKAAEVTEDNFAFAQEFQARAVERARMVNTFQTQVNQYGGEPKSEGGMLGKLHRMTTEFSAMFRDDQKAALEAIDDGEEQLAQYIESKLDEDGIDANTKMLLKQAHASAQAGEKFAERHGG